MLELNFQERFLRIITRWMVHTSGRHAIFVHDKNKITFLQNQRLYLTVEELVIKAIINVPFLVFIEFSFIQVVLRKE